MSNQVKLGMQGAQTGYQYGGVYGAIAGAIIGVLAGGEIDRQQKDVLTTYNKRIQSQVAQSLFDLEGQRSVERARTSQALISYESQKDNAISTVRANYGAYEMIGATTEAVKNTIEFQASEAAAQEWLNFEVGIRNYNTQVNEIVNTGMSLLRGSYEDLTGRASESADIGGFGNMLGQMGQGAGGSGGSSGGFSSSAGSSDFGASSYNFG
jgi:hypothetical protein